MRTTGRRIVELGMIIGLSYVFCGLLSGCNQQNLFPDSEANSRLKYWDDDSAVKTRESRQHESEMGFGFSNGSGN